MLSQLRRANAVIDVLGQPVNCRYEGVHFPVRPTYLNRGWAAGAEQEPEGPLALAHALPEHLHPALDIEPVCHRGNLRAADGTAGMTLVTAVWHLTAYTLQL